ncbi:MAG: DUF3179 domain-containing protein [Chloroflexi bacterium]|nr:DUF3179 domain-containing protein [Chloroflexota bacterium]
MKLPALLLATVFLLAACSGTAPQVELPVADAAAQPSATPPPTQGAAPRTSPGEFSTDFSIHTIPYDQVLSGGPPKDGIPAIDNPSYETVSQADQWLQPNEPVIQVQVGELARAYPIQVLMWHEIANDQLGGLPLTVTFCPLCNTAIIFERALGDRVLDFGTTGRLRFSNLIMYDRQTETWWQQANGEAVAGELTGEQLAFYPGLIVAWQDFKAAFPDGDVLSRETGFFRDYGRNPYVGYDNVNSSPFLFRGPATPNEMPPMTRVLTIESGGEAIAFTYDILSEVSVVNEAIDGQPIAIFWQPGVVSPLDTGLTGSGREVGAAAAFSRNLNGETLTFALDGELIQDEQTASTWNIFGLAVDGSLAGEQLEPVVAINHFWFSWAAFKPATRIYQP